MKVFYRSILKEIKELRRTADLQHRTIERIELSPSEHNELVKEVGSFLARMHPADTEFQCMGIRIVKASKT